MLRVGVPEWAEAEFLKPFPAECEVVTLGKHFDAPASIDFWVAPVYPKAAEAIAPHLADVKVVQSLLAGVDWLLPLAPEGAVVCDAQGVHNVATAEWVVAAILAALKYFPLYGELQQDADWRGRAQADEAYRALHRTEKIFFPPVLGEELAGKRVMIVGYGSIGRSIEERLAPFGVEFIRVARSARAGVEPVSRLADLLPHADVVVLIVPLTPETTGLMTADLIARMPQAALLVNAARGPVVDTAALLDALNDGRIRAAVDVTDPEPLPEDHPLWKAPNLIITPHVAASSPLFMKRAFAFAAEQAARVIRGEALLNVVSGSY
jgi:phosphoglycerate dehydrogenase-like enzyme